MNTWFTADTHFGHKNIITLCNRPYDSVEEMDESLITNWNNMVRDGDVIYHLGDFAFGDPWKYFDRLNGFIKIIPGSHDKVLERDIKSGMGRKITFEKLTEIKVDLKGTQQLIVLCHYAMRSWNKSHYGSWHLYGHHHGNLPPHGLSFDAGVDTNDYYPYSLEDVRNKMKTLSREFVIKEK
jgi:calcineurin-like phosphoesterase family protein